MATPKPKRFFAVRDFRVGVRGPAFDEGDEIEHGATLQSLLRFGDKFAATKNSATPAEPTANPPRGQASESTKED
jgi:hypothetical protein